MDDDIFMGIYVIVVILLIVITFSIYKMACSSGDSSYMRSGNHFGTGYGAASSIGLSAAERSDNAFGNVSQDKASYFMGNGALEQPSFWNMGSVDEVNKYLNNAAYLPETDVDASGNVEDATVIPVSVTTVAQGASAVQAANQAQITANAALQASQAASTTSSSFRGGRSSYMTPKSQDFARLERFVGSGL